MTLVEFKAWFDGFTEEIDVPNKKQWKRIVERLEEVKVGESIHTIERVIERRPWWPPSYTTPQYTWTTSDGHTSYSNWAFNNALAAGKVEYNEVTDGL